MSRQPNYALGADDSYNYSNNTNMTFSSSSPNSHSTNSNDSPRSSSGRSSGNFCQQLQPDVYTYESAQAAAASMPKILENGRKVFGPPANWIGPRPSYLCELFVTRVPQHLHEIWFLIWLHRFGTVYEFRLMMDSGNANRGYAFIRYSKESEAVAACELLSFHYQRGERLIVFRSQGKNRLYISNIPKMLPVETVCAGFKQIFPQLEDIMAYESKNCRALETGAIEHNRGYAFVQFYNHEEALEAKKRTTPGRVRMWNADLKVQWAKPRHDAVNTKTEQIFKGNFPGMVNGYSNDKNLPKYRLLREFNAKLRLLCLANDWCIPIVLYGRNFRQYGVQYGAILLKSDMTGESCCIVMEIFVSNVYDIHQLMSEVAVLLIENQSGFPKDNYILRVKQNQAEIVLLFSSTFTNAQRFRITDYYFHNSDSIIELSETLEILARHTSKDLLDRYKISFLAMTEKPTMCFEEREQEQLKTKIYSILPKFRNNAPLNGNLNDAEINLMLESSDAIAQNISTFVRTMRPLQQLMPKLRLKSQRNNFNNSYVLRYVDARQGNKFYHPAQQINTNPIWISGHSYQQSFYN